MASANPWDPASAPSAAGLLLDHLVASGILTQVQGGGDGVIKGEPAVTTEVGCEVVVAAPRGWGPPVEGSIEFRCGAAARLQPCASAGPVGTRVDGVPIYSLVF